MAAISRTLEHGRDRQERTMISRWPEAGPCGKCGRPGKYVGGHIEGDEEGVVYEVLIFRCETCDRAELGEEIAESRLASKH
jgi:hypothetical protein